MTMTLITPGSPSNVEGLEDPKKFYEILREPAPLSGMAYPRSLDWHALKEAGYEYVVCLTADQPPYNPEPLRVLRSVSMQDQYNNQEPHDPKNEASILRDIVMAITETLQDGKGVVVHCQGGTGRTGTVIACTLKELGVDADVIADYMRALNQVRSKCEGWKGWPESDWQELQMRA